MLPDRTFPLALASLGVAGIEECSFYLRCLHAQGSKNAPITEEERRPARGKYNLGKVPSSYDMRR